MLPRTPFLICAVCGVTTLTLFIYGALLIAIAQIGESLSFKEADLQWPLNVYALVNGCLLLPLGRVNDIVGAKRMFMVGTAWLSIWCIVTPFVQTEELFIFVSAMLGVGSAICTPSGLSIFSHRFEPGPTKDRAIASIGASRSLGYILGLVLGGFLCQTAATWRAIFYIAGGLTALFFAIGTFAIPVDDMTKRYQKGFDWIGFILSTASIASMIVGLLEVNNAREGWKTPWIISLLALSLMGIVLFVLLQRRRELSGKAVTVPISPFTNSKTKLLPVVGIAFTTWAVWNSMDYWLTIFYQQGQGLSPEATSLRMTATAIADILICILIGLILPRIYIPILLLGSEALAATAPLLFALLKMTSPSFITALPIQILLSFSEVVYVVGNLQISNAFDDDSQAVAGSIFNVAIELSSSFGLSISTTVATSVSDAFAASHPSSPMTAILEKGFQAAGWTCFAFSCLSILITVTCLWNIGTTKKTEDAEAATSSQAQTSPPLEISVQLSFASDSESDRLTLKELPLDVVV